MKLEKAKLLQLTRLLGRDAWRMTASDRFPYFNSHTHLGVISIFAKVASFAMHTFWLALQYFYPSFETSIPNFLFFVHFCSANTLASLCSLHIRTIVKIRLFPDQCSHRGTMKYHNPQILSGDQLR